MADTPNKEDELRTILADFMEKIEEVSSEIEGSPTELDMHKLDAVYDTAITKIEARDNPLKEDLKVVGGEDEKLPGEEDGSIIWEAPKDTELRVQLIDALAGTTFGFHSSQLEAIWPLIESRLKETTLSDVERFDYNRLKSLEIGSINRYEEFASSKPDSHKYLSKYLNCSALRVP